MHARVLSVVFDGVDQAVTGGSLQHSRGTKVNILLWISSMNAFLLIWRSRTVSPGWAVWLRWPATASSITWSKDFPQTKHPATHSLRCRWGCNVQFCNASATVEILEGWDKMLMSMGWVDRRDGKGLSDLEIRGVVIRASLEQTAKVGKVVLVCFVVAESAMYIVQGFQLLA